MKIKENYSWASFKFFFRIKFGLKKCIGEMQNRALFEGWSVSLYEYWIYYYCIENGPIWADKIYGNILQYLYKGSILHFTLDVFSSQIHPGQGLCYAIGQLFFIWILKLASNVTYIISNLVLLQHQLEKLFGIGSYSDKDLKKLANVTDTLR